MSDPNQLILLDPSQWVVLLQGEILSLDIQLLAISCGLVVLPLLAAAWFAAPFLGMNRKKKIDMNSDEYAIEKEIALQQSEPFLALAGFMFVMSIIAWIIYSKWNDTCQFSNWQVCPVYKDPAKDSTMTLIPHNIFDFAANYLYYGSIVTALGYIHKLKRGPFVVQQLATIFYTIQFVNNKILYYSTNYFWTNLWVGAFVGMLIAGGSIIFSRASEQSWAKKSWQDIIKMGNVFAALILFPGHWAIIGTVGGLWFFQLGSWTSALYMDLYIGLGMVICVTVATFLMFYWLYSEKLLQDVTARMEILKDISAEKEIEFMGHQKSSFLKRTRNMPATPAKVK